MNHSSFTVGSFPYAPGFNPYQRLFTTAVEKAGVKVVRIPPEKWFPLQRAVSTECDVLHLDWPHDWYEGRNPITKTLKTWMYRQGLKQLRRKPTVWTVHNLVAHDSADEKHDRQMIQELIDQCCGLMVMSDASHRQLNTDYSIPKSTEVRKISHGHYIDCYENVVSREDARETLGIAADQCVFLTLGSIKPYKGHEQLIAAFSKTAKPNDLLLIAGGGDSDFLCELQNRSDEFNQSGHGAKIRIEAGLVDNDRLQYFFNAADVTVLPFQNILNSGSLLLAMSFGCPVVAPRIGSVPETACRKWHFGYEISPSDSGGLVEALVEARSRVFKTRDHQLIRDEVIEFTRTRYDWAKIGNQLANWYSELLS